jgi:hypothetical protein
MARRAQRVNRFPTPDGGFQDEVQTGTLSAISPGQANGFHARLYEPFSPYCQERIWPSSPDALDANSR